MRRRDFIKVIMGTAVAWPLAARAQQSDRVRRIGVLMGFSADDPEAKSQLAAFQKGLEEFGLTEARNVRIEYRFVGADAARARAYAAELIGLRPDVLVGHTFVSVTALLQQTRTIPIVFVSFPDPVGEGLVASLARPGGNITGFSNLEFSLGGKWLGLLKDVAPRVDRVSILFNPQTASHASNFLRVIEAAAQSFSVKPIAAPVHNAAEIESAIDALGREPGGGLIVMPDIITGANRELIVGSAASHRVPAVYPFRFFAKAGGLMSYGIDVTDLFRRAPSYVDRILKGAKPAELPVQQPTKFELVINRNAAKVLGLKIPDRLYFTADEVIE